MKAMILAAGLGTRLRPATDRVPKPLFPVLGVPAIEWAIRALAGAGVTEAVVNLHHHPAAIVRALGSGERHGVRLTYSDEPVVLGTGGGLSAVREFFRGEDAFLLHNGDAFTDWDLADLVSRHRESGAAATLALSDPEDRPEARLVEVCHAGNRVVGIRGRPQDRGGPRYVYSGIAVLGPRVFDFLPPGEASCLVERGLIPMMAAGIKVCGEVQGGLFCDIGTADRYLDLQWELHPRMPALFAARGLPVPGGAEVDPTATVIEPAVICRGARVGAGATIGPRAVVCEGASVAPGAIVRDAVVFPGVAVEGAVGGIVA
jgi:NDP-sugar pyrophosphorylase family protein